LESATARKAATHVTAAAAEATAHMGAAAEATGMAATAATAAMTATTATAATSQSAGGHRGRSQRQGSDEDDCSVQLHLPHGTYFLSITELTRRIIARLNARSRSCSCVNAQGLCPTHLRGRPVAAVLFLLALERNCEILPRRGGATKLPK
jgi:hypothetical protein